LKGSGTVVTDGDISYVNSSGSSALAKAGSGDVLAGLLTSLLAFSTDALKTAALAVYIHGRAGDNLAAELSEFGVTPSDLPRECARVIAELSK
jgi:NAD(P)H-hydrate epimerase